MTTRRAFLAGGAALVSSTAVPVAAWAGAQGKTVLEAKEGTAQIAPAGYARTAIWGYDGGVPGPEIRLRQGDRLQRTFLNGLPQPSTVHWHGLRIDNAMDGIPGLTQQAVQPGQTFDYSFTAPDAGTYWYHAHERSTEQVARGLYGPLIVEEPEQPDVDREEVLVLDDWLLNPETAQLDPDYMARHDRSHAGRRGNLIVTNGRYDLSIPARRHERLRLRLINAANARIFELGLAGFEGWVLAEDGMPLAAPRKIAGTFLLGPGQRMDLFVDVVAEVGDMAHLVHVVDGEGLAQVSFPVQRDNSRTRRAPPTALPANPAMEISGLETAQKARLHMEGGAMGRLQTAVLDGKERTFRQLVQANQFWSFNGTVGMTDTPLVAVDKGRAVRLEIFNDTVFPHAMHLHGMHFREVMTDGQFGPLRDTLLMIGGQTREIAFMADNPGDWLFHCHMLGHAASGMMTWVRVAA